MSHAYRDTAAGDALDLRRAMRELQQQLNERKQANRQLHAENRRLKQHVKGLESKLVESSLENSFRALNTQSIKASSSPGRLSVSVSAAASDSWTGRVTTAGPAGGSLRSSTAGDSSALRAFKEAAAQARAQATDVTAELSNTQQELRQGQQQLRQATEQLSKLQAAQTALQAHVEASNEAHSSTVLRLETDKRVLQQELQQLRQALQSKQQETLQFQQQLQQQHAQQLMQQQAERDTLQQQLGQLAADHTQQLRQVTQQLQAEQQAAAAAAAETQAQLEVELQHVKHTLSQVADLQEGQLASGWSCQSTNCLVLPSTNAIGECEVASTLPTAPADAATAAGTAPSNNIQDQTSTSTPLEVTAAVATAATASQSSSSVCDSVCDGSSRCIAGSEPIHLQVLLHSLISQPSLLGVRKQDWWPLLMVAQQSPAVAAGGAAGGSGGSSTSTVVQHSRQVPGNAHNLVPHSCSRLLAAVTARSREPGLLSSGSSSSSSSSSGTADGDFVQHQLQLQLPRQLSAQTIEWMRNGQLQLLLLNAKASAVGVFKVTRQLNGSSSSSSSSSADASSVEKVTSGSNDVAVLAVLLALSSSCWMVGLYEMTADGQPGQWLAALGQQCESSSTQSHNTPCSCHSKTVELASSSSTVNAVEVNASSAAALHWLGVGGTGGRLLPELQPGEVLVPVGLTDNDGTSSSSVSAAIAAQNLSSGCTAAVAANRKGPLSCRVAADTQLYNAALTSHLFSKTGRRLELQQACTCTTSSSSSSSVLCEVWQLQSAASRSAHSAACLGKGVGVAAAQPWLGAQEVLATAALPVNTAMMSASAAEAAAAARRQLLAQFACASKQAACRQLPLATGTGCDATAVQNSSTDSTDCAALGRSMICPSAGSSSCGGSNTVNTGSSTAGSSGSGTVMVDLLHVLRSRPVAWLHATLRYNHPISDVIWSYEHMQRQRQQHAQHIAALNQQLGKKQQQLEAAQQQLEVHQHLIEQQKAQLKEANIELVSQSAALQGQQQRVQQLESEKQQVALQTQQALAQQQQKVAVLQYENEELQRLVEQQLEQLDELEQQVEVLRQQQQQQSVLVTCVSSASGDKAAHALAVEQGSPDVVAGQEPAPPGVS